ncbi:MAG: VWA domain-containing protein [Colwellia sp.]|nr:VWA domain-containing protein [Colwellia sp.]MCW8865372.1 VWA domain-containing protein [Colwellia sp.]MCW9080728.1 VWA domain-containing protein [Colwellia sp.]
MTSFTLFLSNFHFIRPWWFLALIALFFALWLLKKHRFNHSPWNKLLPSHLSQVLVEGSTQQAKKSTNRFFSTQANLLKPFIIGLISIIALAGPAWQKLPQPVYQTDRGSVLIMDMSYSMYATDIKPNRLTRARYKAVDLLSKINEGDIGLIAYAGDAFVISPLTQDIKNIELLLPSLSPDIMPELGANPFAALALAHDMLQNAGHINGDIYWFTDDVDNEDLSDIYDWSAKYGHQLNILGIGSQEGAPITLPSGELLKDNMGAIVVPKLPIQKLTGLAKRGNGHYETISHSDSDIEKLVSHNTVLAQQSKTKQQSQQQGDQWQEQGPWLLLIILPLILTYFRRGGAILVLPITCLPALFLLTITLNSTTAFAAEQPEAVSTTQGIWNSLWKTDNQQAQQRYNQQDYQGAAEQFKDSQWQGSAHYKAGNYQEALNAFKQGEQANSANALYNQGNALAQMQQYEQAIEHYEQALKKNPDMQDAKDNIEKIKQQQKKQEQEQNQQQNDQSQDNQPQDEEQNQNEQQQDAQDQGSQEKNNEQSQQQQDSEQGQQNNNEQQSQAENSEQESNDNEKESSAEQQKQEQQNQQEQQQKSAEQSQEQNEKNEQGKEKSAAQIAKEQQAKETEQKHQQMLNKVTDDPYLLLRNKMQLEYQKRKQDGASQGAKKKW